MKSLRVTLNTNHAKMVTLSFTLHLSTGKVLILLELSFIIFKVDTPECSRPMTSAPSILELDANVLDKSENVSR